MKNILKKSYFGKATGLYRASLIDSDYDLFMTMVRWLDSFPVQ